MPNDKDRPQVTLSSNSNEPTQGPTKRREHPLWQRSYRYEPPSESEYPSGDDIDETIEQAMREAEIATPTHDPPPTSDEYIHGSLGYRQRRHPQRH